MSDYISRAIALDLCPNNAVETLKKIPAADVRPVVRGKWTKAPCHETDEAYTYIWLKEEYPDDKEE